jgi:putative redox protein
MSQQLKTVIAETQERFRLEPESAIVHFESSSCLQEGLQSQARMRQHTLVVDEPVALGGADTGPNPVEIVLAALGTCQEITYRAYATALGIPLERVSVKLDGEVDLRGFLGVPPDVRPGYRHITGTVTLVSSAPAEQLEKLRDAVNAHCPVLDIITNKVPVELALDLRPTGG